MNRLDQSGFEDLARRTIAAIDAMAAAARQLAEAETEAHSPDRRVLVRVTASGTITDLRLRDGVLRRYDTAALGDVVTRTVRDAQQRARDTYLQQVAALTPPEVAECARTIERIWRN